MPRRKEKGARQTTCNKGSAASIGYEAELSKMADPRRGSKDTATHKHAALRLLFLKYISDVYAEKGAAPIAKQSSGADQNLTSTAQRGGNWATV